MWHQCWNISRRRAHTFKNRTLFVQHAMAILKARASSLVCVFCLRVALRPQRGPSMAFVLDWPTVWQRYLRPARPSQPVTRTSERCCVSSRNICTPPLTAQPPVQSLPLVCNCHTRSLFGPQTLHPPCGCGMSQHSFFF